MASTFTNNLLIENPTPQDPAQKNVWGTTENTGRTLFDSAIAGIQPLNLPAQAGYPTVILTSSQGQPDQARNAHFVFSGTLTANTLVLFPQSRNRMFTVNNTATGAFTVTVGVNNGSGAAAGTTVVAPQGQSLDLFSDGTNVATRVNGVVGGLTVSGGGTVDNLTVSGSATYPNPTVGGTANAITLTYPVTPAGNVQGAKYAFKATAANTGPTNININGLGAKNIYQRTATGPAALTGGEIQVGDIVELAYDGTEFVMLSRAPSEPVNAQTGTSYTVLSTDQTKLLTFANAAAIAVTLPQATGSFGAGWYADFSCLSSSAGAVTITPTTSTVDGVASLVLTPGQACRLVSDGTNYQTVKGLSGVRPLGTFTASNAAQITVTGLTGYKTFLLEVEEALPVTDGSNLLVQFSSNGGSTWLNSGIGWAWLNATSLATTGNQGSSSDSSIQLANNVSTFQSVGYSGRIELHTGGAGYTVMRAQGTFYAGAAGSGGFVTNTGGGVTAVTTINALRILPPSGNISGTVRLYGMS